MYTRALAIVVALIFVSACGQSSSSTMPTPPIGGGSSVSIVSGSRTLTTTAYNPNPVTISAGMSVTWINNDTIAHTSTSDNGIWDSGSLGPGASFNRAFPSPGTFTYHCAIPPNMIGTVTVR